MFTNLSQLKDQIDIVDILSNSIELKKSGANFKACCPFHGEDTPSFVVSPTKQICHCFGCGYSSDTIGFVQEYKKLSFAEAIEDIANDLNFTLEYDSTQQKKDYKSIFESVNSLYIKSLQDDNLKYLLDRGVTKKSIKTFEIGYAGTSQSQIEFMKQNFLNMSDAIDVAILGADKDKMYSRQIKRITFPIRNHTGKLIGFGGRTTINHNAKYINSAQTKLFDKSRNLYGYNIAKEHIYKKGTIVVTEGYLDVVMMHQANIQTAVATMGTALTEQHCIMIKKIGCRVLLCYDGDKAGKNAALKASVLLSQHEIDGGVVLFEDGIDPADMVADGKVAELIAIMKKPIPLIEFALQVIVLNYELTNPHLKNKALKECVDFLKSLNNLLIANEYKQYLANLLKIQVSHITLGQTQIEQQPSCRTQQNGKKINRADDKILKTILENPDFLDIAMNNMDYEVMSTNLVFVDIIDGKTDSSLLIPLKIREDVIIYNKTDFISACKLKQKSFLEEQLKKLSQNTDDDVFLKMDRLQKRIKDVG